MIELYANKLPTTTTTTVGSTPPSPQPSLPSGPCSYFLYLLPSLAFFQNKLRHPRNFSWPFLTTGFLYCSAFVAFHLQITTRGTAKQSARSSSARSFHHSFPSFLSSSLKPSPFTTVTTFKQLTPGKVFATRKNRELRGREEEDK